MRRLLAAATTIALTVIAAPASKAQASQSDARAAVQQASKAQASQQQSDARAAVEQASKAQAFQQESDARAAVQQASKAQAFQHEASPAGRIAPTIKWSACAESALRLRKAECGMLSVPLDHAAPYGEKIQIAVSRIRHTVAEAKYQGVVLVNPGGPGGKGRALSVMGALVPKGAGAAYDWIGFDPRGVGASKPSLSCDAGYTGYNRPAYVPTTPKIERAWLQRAEGYARACGKAGGKLLEHLKSLDTVRDMDLLRQALNARQINYFGFSYGTYLGQVYATRYPERVRRMVLDGNVNPARVWYDSNLDQDIAFDRNIKIYFGWIAKNHRAYRLGRTGREVERRFYAEQKNLARKPAGGRIGPSELTDIFLQAGYYTFGWDGIARAFSDWVRDGDASGLRRLYDANNPQTKDADNNYAIYLGVQCTDAEWPQSWTKWTADNWEVHRKAPFETWANAWYNAPCRTWPARSGIPVTVSGETVPPVLLVSETLDAATPFSGSLEVRKRFPRSVLIEGVNGTTHSGSLSGNRCVDDTIADYLATGKLPKRLPGERSDKRCKPIQPPAAVAATTAKRAPAPVEEVRKLITGR